MACNFSASVMLLFISMALTALLAVAALCLALTGGLPETYRAARPLPGAEAGNRRARTVESLGMISVSSVYSTLVLVLLYVGPPCHVSYLHRCFPCRS